MKNINTIFLLFTFTLFFSCNKEELNVNQPVVNNNNNGPCTDSYCDNTNDKVFYENGVRWLWGGTNDDWHFNISNLNINPNNLKFGLGREFFKALIEPEYVPMQEVSSLFVGSDEFIIIYAEEGIKAYSLDLLKSHEVINDVIDGEPIMVGYCPLADFTTVFSRIHCGQTLTFALSGYTYSEEDVWEGRDGFVLWDRETESLWWPFSGIGSLSGAGISGGMIDVMFNTDLDFEWDRVDWNYIESNFTDVEILAYGQDMEIPSQWRHIDTDDLDCN